MQRPLVFCLLFLFVFESIVVGSTFSPSSCWDTNSDKLCSSDEDINGDGICNSLDCYGTDILENSMVNCSSNEECASYGSRCATHLCIEDICEFSFEEGACSTDFMCPNTHKCMNCQCHQTCFPANCASDDSIIRFCFGGECMTQSISLTSCQDSQLTVSKITACPSQPLDVGSVTITNGKTEPTIRYADILLGNILLGSSNKIYVNTIQSLHADTPVSVDSILNPKEGIVHKQELWPYTVGIAGLRFFEGESYEPEIQQGSPFSGVGAIIYSHPFVTIYVVNAQQTVYFSPAWNSLVGHEKIIRLAGPSLNILKVSITPNSSPYSHILLAQKAPDDGTFVHLQVMPDKKWRIIDGRNYVANYPPNY